MLTASESHWDHLSVYRSRLWWSLNRNYSRHSHWIPLSLTQRYLDLFLFLFCLSCGHLPKAALDPRVWPSNSQWESQVAYGHILFSPWISSAREADLSRDPEGERWVEAGIETTSYCRFQISSAYLGSSSIPCPA